MIQMCHLNWNITWAVALEVTNINFLIAHFATIYENIISLHVGPTLLYKSMVRPHVEFANSVWCPYKIDDIKEIEKIQKRATKLVIKLKNKSYIDNLLKPAYSKV